MPYIYEHVDSLEGHPKIGSKQCVALVQLRAGAPTTPHWKQGEAVKGLLTLLKGTAIATFNSNGKYLSNSTGNHAALYLSQDAGGIWVMDQWADDKTKPTISKRYIKFKGGSPGRHTDPSNNGDAYYVIE